MRWPCLLTRWFTRRPRVDLAEFERQLDANLAARRARRAARSEAARKGWSTRRRTGHA